MLGEFDKETFAALLQQALGERSAYRYSQEVNVSRNHISLLLRKETKTVPSPETIKKLAEKADNGVTYEQLMIAAGHLASPSEAAAIQNMIESDLESGIAKKLSDIAPPELSQEFQKLGFELASFMHDKEVTLDELQELLVMLRALKKNKKR